MNSVATYRTICGRIDHFAQIETQSDRLLERLVSADIVVKENNSFRLATSVCERIESLREADRRKEGQINDIVSRVTKILTTLPQGECDAITAETWFSQRLDNFEISFADAIAGVDARFEQMNVPLWKIERMMFQKGAITEDLLRLPIARERERQRVARQKDDSDRKAAEEAARVGRIDRITSAAQKLGDDATAWLANPSVAGLDGRSSRLASEASQAELDRVLAALSSELWRREDELEREARVEVEKKKQAEKILWFQDRLTDQAERTLGKEKGPLFLRSPYAELGRKALSGNKVVNHRFG